MTTTEEPTTATQPEPEAMCQRCNIPLNRVEGTDVTFCNGCGGTWGAAQAVKPDEVSTPGSSVEHFDADHAAKEFDERAQLDMPLIPGLEEFRALAMQARIMAMSGIVPKALQGKPADVFVVLLTGRDLGIPITSAINQIHVIEGRPSLAPKLLNARLRQIKAGRIVPGQRNERMAEAIAIDTEGRELGRTSFSWEEAQGGGLVMMDCQPGAHTTKCLNYSSKGYERCRQGYRTYPQRMMWWRAAGWCADDYFPEASLGLYSPEELGAVVDDEGTPIDPANIELPPGFEPPEPAPDPGAELANPNAVAHIKARIADLPEEQRAQLKTRWQEKQDEGRLQHIDRLTERGIKIAGALLGGQEAIAKGTGWKPSVNPDPSSVAPVVAQDPPEGAGGADTAAEPAQGPQDEPGATQDVPGEPADRLAVQRGKPDAQVTEALVDQAIALVKPMTVRQLNAALKSRGFATDGDEGLRRQALARATASEMAEQDWIEANPPASDDA